MKLVVTEIEEWIHAAIETYKLAAIRVDEAGARLIVETARGKFVQGRPRAWWMSLDGVVKRLPSEGVGLLALLPEPGNEVYFIPETESRSLPVYSAVAKDVAFIIDECPFFEYYVVDSQFRWLIAESDHNEYFVCGDAWRQSSATL